MRKVLSRLLAVKYLALLHVCFIIIAVIINNLSFPIQQMAYADTCSTSPDMMSIDEDELPPSFHSANTDQRITPLPRGPTRGLAGLLYSKMIRDEELMRLDKRQWYACDLSSLPELLSTQFVQLELDGETACFLQHSQLKSDSVITQLWHSFLKSILSLFMTKTSINGLLGRGSMFVFSTRQFLQLLDADATTWHAESVLDLGAGDGRITDVMAPFFTQTYVTEVSGPMRWTLTAKKYNLLEIEEWFEPPFQFDVISCLNLLDRCDMPLTMMRNIKAALKPGGFVLLALVLPFSPFVESGDGGDNKPLEHLSIDGVTFEDQVTSITSNLLEPSGFEVVRWTKVPYLCEGDLFQAYYWLSDVIFTLRLRENDEDFIDVSS